jgi:hypothetical protein
MQDHLLESSVVVDVLSCVGEEGLCKQNIHAASAMFMEMTDVRFQNLLDSMVASEVIVRVRRGVYACPRAQINQRGESNVSCTIADNELGAHADVIDISVTEEKDDGDDGKIAKRTRSARKKTVTRVVSLADHIARFGVTHDAFLV